MMGNVTSKHTILMKSYRRIQLTSEKPFLRSWRSSAGCLNSHEATHKTAGGLLMSSPPRWAAPGLSESCSVGLWPKEVQASP